MSAADRLAQIRAQAEVATPGPWTVQYLLGQGNDLLYALVRVSSGEVKVVGSTLAEADARLIAQARESVPALLAAVEAVLALHRIVPMVHENGAMAIVLGYACDGCSYCAEDEDDHCPTRRAIERALP